MDEKTETRLTELKQRIARGDYRIDAGAIADAMLRRFREHDVYRALGAEAQTWIGG